MPGAFRQHYRIFKYAGYWEKSCLWISSFKKRCSDISTGWHSGCEILCINEDNFLNSVTESSE